MTKVKGSLHVAALSWAFLAIGIAACDETDGESRAAGGRLPPEVSVIKVQSQDLALHTDLPGRTTASRVVDIRPQVGGIVQKRLFKEGSIVKKGAQLYQIDPARYQAAIASAKAGLAKANATMKAVRAKAVRYRDLVKVNAVSKQEYEDAVAALDQAKADVMVAEAAIRIANINLAYTKVYAPISGHIGKSSITEGALVTADQAASLATITQLDPIYVDVSETSSDLLRLKKSMENGTVTGKAGAQVRLLLDSAGTTYEKVGHVQFSEVTVDPSTSTVQLRAVFPNPDHDLYPGLFIRARVEQGTIPDAILVSQRAVIRQADGGTHVWVVAQDGTVSQRPVKVGQAIGTSWLVKSGLKSGEQVVIAGLQKVAPGAMVRIAASTENATTHVF